MRNEHCINETPKENNTHVASCEHTLWEVFVSCSITLWVYILAVVNKMVKIRLTIDI